MLTLLLVFTMLTACSLAILTWAARPSRSQKRVIKRLSEVGLTAAMTPGKETPQDALLLRPEEEARPSGIERLLAVVGLHRRLQKLIEQADSPVTPRKFLLHSLGMGAGAAIITALFGVAMLGVLPAAVVPGCLPYVLLRLKRARRLKAFNQALPDAIDLMARALRAGRSVASAIEVIAEQGQKPVSIEFAKVFKQQNFGLPFRESLISMTERVPSQDLHFLVTAMLVQKETGGNLTEILDRATHVIRERIRIHGEVRVKTAQGRLTGWILSLLPIVMGALINFVNPGFERPLFEDPIGRIMLYCGAGMLVVGGLIIRKIVDIEV